jgi:hypothetical protein
MENTNIIKRDRLFLSLIRNEKNFKTWREFHYKDIRDYNAIY